MSPRAKRAAAIRQPLSNSTRTTSAYPRSRASLHMPTHRRVPLAWAGVVAGPLCVLSAGPRCGAVAGRLPSIRARAGHRCRPEKPASVCRMSGGGRPPVQDGAVTTGTSDGVRTRLWRDGRFEVEGFPLEEISDYLQEEGALVWLDLCEP